MKTIKFILANDGSVVSSSIGFQINQYSYNDTLINVYVPNEILNTETNTETYTYANGIAMSMYYTLSGGTRKLGNSYYFTYVKNNVVIDGKTYTLFERKMPKEFTLYYGTQQYAINVILYRTNISLNPPKTEIIGNITSGEFDLSINQSLNIIDNPQEVDTDLSTLDAKVNSLLRNILLKQDITDGLIHVLTQNGGAVYTTKVVDALNYLNTRVKENYDTNGSQDGDISALDGRVSDLEDYIITGFRYIGTTTSNVAPNSNDLDSFVVSQGYTKQNGDIVIWIQTIAGGEDKNYRCIYSNSGWTWYDIPPTETASNDNYGIVKGNYGSDTTSDILVSIIGGKIVDLYFKQADNTYASVKVRLNSLQTTINEIISGTQAVGKSSYATYDSTEENKIVKTNINDKFMTQQYGATKLYVQDYALPRTFNDVFKLELMAGPYSLFIQDPTFDIEHSSVSTQLGDVTLLEARLEATNDIKYQLSNKNSYKFDTYIKFSSPMTDVSFTFNTYLKVHNDPSRVLIASTTTDTLNFEDTNIKHITFADYFNRINAGEVLEFDNTKEYEYELIAHITSSATNTMYIYSSATYTSTYTLSTDSYTLMTSQSGIITHSIRGVYDSTYNIIKFELGNIALVDKTQHLFMLSLPVGMNWDTIPANCCYQLYLNGTDIGLILNTDPNYQFMGLLYKFRDGGETFVFEATCVDNNGTFEFIVADTNATIPYLPRQNDITYDSVNDKYVVSDELAYLMSKYDTLLKLSIWVNNWTYPAIIARLKTYDDTNEIYYYDTFDMSNDKLNIVKLKVLYNRPSTRYELVAEHTNTLNVDKVSDVNNTSYTQYSNNRIENKVGTNINNYCARYYTLNGIEDYFKFDANSYSRMSLDRNNAYFYNTFTESATQYMPKRESTTLFGIYNYPYITFNYEENDVEVVDALFEINKNGFRLAYNENTLSLSRATNKLTYNSNEIIDTNNATTELFLTDGEMTTLISEVFD